VRPVARYLIQTAASSASVSCHPDDPSIARILCHPDDPSSAMGGTDLGQLRASEAGTGF
jgi:hypothetical protein